MTSSYGLRLALLCSACFFAVNLAAGLLIRLSVGSLIRRASLVSTRSAAKLLFGARLAPTFLSVAVVLGLCVPSFLLHEQRATAEGIGAPFLIGALLGLAAFGDGLVRGARALLSSSRFVRHAGHARGLVALAGMVRPRLLVTQDVVETLTRDELDAALRHEYAHRLSQDNLKQLLILLTPSLLPGWRGLDSLERAWKQFTEFAADDYAAAGDAQRSVDLANALVRVSRLSASPTPALTASLLDSCGHLEWRVSRLLSRASASPQPPSRLALVAAIALVFTAAFPLLHPASLLAVHNLLEKLIQ